METVANNTSAAFLAARLPSRKDLGLRNWEQIRNWRQSDLRLRLVPVSSRFEPQVTGLRLESSESASPNWSVRILRPLCCSLLLPFLFGMVLLLLLLPPPPPPPATTATTAAYDHCSQLLTRCTAMLEIYGQRNEERMFTKDTSQPNALAMSATLRAALLP